MNVSTNELLTLVQELDIGECSSHFQRGLARHLSRHAEFYGGGLDDMSVGQLRQTVRDYQALYTRIHGGLH